VSDVPTPADGAPRLLRAAGLTSLVLALGALAHTLGGGHLPSGTVLAVLGVLLLPVAVLACGRQVRPVTATALLGAGQLLLHHAFALLTACGTGTLAARTGHLVHTGHLPAADLAPTAATTATAAATTCHAAATTTSSTAMLALHVAATVVTALLVAATERGLWLLAHGLRPVLDRLVARLADALRTAARPGTDPLDRAHPTAPVATRVAPPPRLRPVGTVAPRRGPPRLLGPRAPHATA
jgi:hypothetical protein